jgi:YVTN family beta-propeller protein
LGKKIREITGGPETEGIEFSKDGKQLIVTNEADNTVTVHSMKTGKLLKTIKTHEYGDRPRGIKVSPDGKTYLATLEYGNKFLVMDKKFKVLRTVDTGATPYGIAYDRKGERIYVAANKAKTLEVYNAKTYEKIKDIPTGNRCWHFTFTPDDKEILLACGKSDAVMVIDTDKLEVTQQIENKKLPWGVVTYPKSMGSLDTAIK